MLHDDSAPRPHRDENGLHPHNSPSHNSQSKRKSRAKPHLSWEQHELMTNGYYAQHLQRIARNFPALTPMEQRVAALVSGMLPSIEIARILGLREHTVENHRTAIRHKLALSENESLVKFLQRLWFGG